MKTLWYLQPIESLKLRESDFAITPKIPFDLVEINSIEVGDFPRAGTRRRRALLTAMTAARAERERAQRVGRRRERESEKRRRRCSRFFFVFFTGRM